MRPGFLTSLLLFALAALGVAQAGEPASPDRVLWDRTPIRIALPVGHERIVHFPVEVRVGVPARLEGLLRTFNVDGSVYWLAHAPFESVRVVIEGLDDGRVYLVDLEAREGDALAPLAVMERETSSDPRRGARDDAERHQNLDYVTLTRFAAQQMYAPERLRPSHPGVVRTPVARSEVPLVRGAAVRAEPLISWRHGAMYVTVVKLVNESADPLVLDPRDLRYDWLAATFQHARLLPAGDEADTTAVYLISRRPFDETVWGAR
ncbi:integrating conjugative element protein [Thioalkalivibrio denitrificans]|uniref:Integrating conjugative element protein n=1 Tax=Thioalkalivibrio denitrificans TaxID=108003 RepID=A0A1V3NV27_9GAMM|nr:TIGR03749 family integrating conjugative element protein [Thioalkalivibrio denitrificans]OOG28824.1 integrating conjugative element protein [Thioalkalivibrio denitrificans]